MRRFLSILLVMALPLSVGAVCASAAGGGEAAVAAVNEEPAAPQASGDYQLNNPFDDNPFVHWDDKTYYQDTLARFFGGIGKFLRWIVVHIFFGWLWFPWVGWSVS